VLIPGATPNIIAHIDTRILSCHTFIQRVLLGSVETVEEKARDDW
jgi:hypothetical protein